MELLIRSDGYDCADNVRRYIEQKLELVFRHFEPWLGRVDVLVDEGEDPRGTRRICRIRTAIFGYGVITVRAPRTDGAGAADLACDQISEMISRELENGVDYAFASIRADTPRQYSSM